MRLARILHPSVQTAGRWGPRILGLIACAAVSISAATPKETTWNPAAAAKYLDSRAAWWLTWSYAQKDHETACVSCHTTVPYAMARPSIASGGEMPAPQQKLLEYVSKRVRLWKEVEPFYSDQTRGLPKTSESRGTEAVLNALILATRDARTGTLSADTRQAFDNMWLLQFKTGELKGAWAWFNFHMEPWESSNSPYYGATLAAIAMGSAPEGYAARPEIEERVAMLCEYLQRGVETESLFNRLMALWASSKLPGVLSIAQRQAIIDAALAKQQTDGGWSMASLGLWKRSDGTPLETKSDGYATGLTTLALQEAGVAPKASEPLGKGLSWLATHQDAATGMWLATSLNKQRDPESDAGKFMNDAATAYAVLSLTRTK